jgi:transcriptional regulator
LRGTARATIASRNSPSRDSDGAGTIEFFGNRLGSKRHDIMMSMYIPPLFAETRVDVLHAFIRAHPLGTLITNGPHGPEATHLPVFLDASSGLLRCHMARANPHWRRFESDTRVLVIFSGADHYVTPTWYPSTREHGKVVPTWNYVAVHAAGTARLFADAPSLLRHLNELTDSHEAGFAEGWSVADAPPEYIESLAKTIIGVEIAIDRLEGKWKVSQNRPEADQQGVIAALDAIDSHASHEMANLMRDRKATR